MQQCHIYNCKEFANNLQKLKYLPPWRIIKIVLSITLQLGKISKNILEQINKDLANHLPCNQWKNASCIMEWFKNINEKNKCAFIQLNINEFYPSIAEDILENVIIFAKTLISTTNLDLRNVKHCRRSLLFSKEEVWKKKSTASCFVITMGSYDGTEMCELVGAYILSHPETIINKNKMGLYRDDGLLFLRGANGQKTNKTRKNIVEISKNIGFQIDIVTNLKVVNFLDATFNLTNRTFRRYKKPNDKLLYIQISSNHLLQIIKQRPIVINERLNHNYQMKQYSTPQIKLNMKTL